MSPRVARIALVMLAALTLSATGPGWVAARDDDANLIEIKDHDRVEPALLQVAAGTTVTWRNEDDATHRIRDDRGTFGSESLRKDASYSRRFDAGGTYSYSVGTLLSGGTWHWMSIGTLKVSGAAPAPLPAPPAVGVPLPGAPPPAAPPSGAARVQILDNSFSPATLTVTAGTTVTWTNTGSAKHTVTSAGFDSGILASGASWSHTFTAPGTYGYVCDLHSGMSGTVVVTGTAQGTAPTAAAAPLPAAAPTPLPSRGAGSRPGARTIIIADNVFEPGTIRVPVGTTVVWVNHGVLKHTATSNGSVFDSGILSPNGEFSVTFGTPGTYPYICDLHPGMGGSIAVYAQDGTTPPAAAGAAPAPVQPATSNDTALPAAHVAMGDDSFSPRALRVATGTTVTWMNGGLAKHTVTARDGSFSSALLGSGQGYSHAFTKAGTYAYLCSLHPAMIGAIDVTDATTAAVAAPAARANVVAAGPPTASRGDIGGAIAIALALLLAACAAVAIGSRLATAQPGASTTIR